MRRSRPIHPGELGELRKICNNVDSIYVPFSAIHLNNGSKCRLESRASETKKQVAERVPLPWFSPTYYPTTQASC